MSDFANSTCGESSNGFPDVAVCDVLVLPEKPNQIWVGSEIGLFLSRDNGASRTCSDNGHSAVSIWRLRAVDAQVLIATHGRKRL